jgi:hypothetical protein
VIISHYLWLNYNLVIRGMNNNVMQMQVELNIENLLKNMLLIKED